MCVLGHVHKPHCAQHLFLVGFTSLGLRICMRGVSFTHLIEPFLCQWSPGLTVQYFISTSTMRVWDGAHNLGPSWKESKEEVFLLVIPLHCMPSHPEPYVTLFFKVHTYQRELFLVKGSPFLVTEPPSIALAVPSVHAHKPSWTHLCHPAA